MTRFSVKWVEIHQADIEAETAEGARDAIIAEVSKERHGHDTFITMDSVEATAMEGNDEL